MSEDAHDSQADGYEQHYTDVVEEALYSDAQIVVSERLYQPFGQEPVVALLFTVYENPTSARIIAQEAFKVSE